LRKTLVNVLLFSSSFGWDECPGGRGGKGEDFFRASTAFTAALAEGMVVKQGTRYEKATVLILLGVFPLISS